MVEGKRKSHRERRVFVRKPSGKAVIQYKPRKPKFAHCASCKKPLKGIARVAKPSSVNKTKRTVSRPYGGMLCSACMRKKIIEKSQ